jgi:type I restriction enzyme S subunit
MRWCLRVKLAQNWAKFSELLLATGDRPIVEESRKDHFWGAKPADAQTLIGINVLGRLLMELREEVKQSEDPKILLRVEPLLIPDFLLYSQPILPAVAHASKETYRPSERAEKISELETGATQGSLWAQPPAPGFQENDRGRGFPDTIDGDIYRTEEQAATENAASARDPSTMNWQRISLALRSRYKTSVKRWLSSRFRRK